jgi:hypothetical protein
MKCRRRFVHALSAFVLVLFATLTARAQSCCDILPLRITEVNYNPTVSNAYEFVELQNIGSTNLNIGGFALDGVTFIFPTNAMLAAGARLVLSSDLAPLSYFAQRYPGVTVAGQFTGNLDNNGERLALRDASGRTITAVHYKDGGGWPQEPDGLGLTLEVIDPAGDPNDPANWRTSAVTNGMPLSVSPPLPAPAVIFHEVMAENVTAVAFGTNYPDWVEFFNPSPTNVNLGGWSFSDDGDERKFVFPPTNLSPGGFLVVWCDNDTNSPGLHSGFVLNKSGETLSLYDATTNRIDAITFGLQAKDKSVGRIGGVWQLTEPTLGGANAAALTASPTNLVINEWLVNPTPGKDDWFELLNRDTNRPLALRGLFFATTNALFQARSLSFIEPDRFLQIHADENEGPDHVEFKLPGAGGAIAVFDSAGVLLDQVTYSALGPGVSQGRFPDGSANIVVFTNSASPGSTNFFLDYAGPLLNEFMARNLASPVVDSQGRRADWVELYNPLGVAFDMGGMRLSEGNRDRGEWHFPTGVVVAAHSHLILWCDGLRPESTNAEPDLNLGRPLDGDNGGLFLFDPVGHLVDSVIYGPQVTDRSVGRLNGQWQLLASATPGTTNSTAATLGDPISLKINEWMAFPTNGADWFELYNPDALPVLLSGLYLSDDASPFGITNTLIQPLTFISPAGYVQFFADGDPSQGANHVRFNLLSGGESLVISSSPTSIINQVDFTLQTQGQSEGRLPNGSATIVSFPFTPTPGASNTLPIAPTFLLHPQSQTIVQNGSVTFSIMATGFPNVLFYQWRKGASSVSGATNSTFTITNVQPANGGGYNCRVSNAGGSRNSNAALLTVLADTDGDGLPDNWEIDYDLDENDPLDAASDSDHDGLSNLQEFLAGTNPTNALSVLKLDPFTVLSGDAVMTFFAVSNHTYTAQWSEQVTNAPWLTWSNITSASTNRLLTLTNSPLAPVSRYFRVVTP